MSAMLAPSAQVEEILSRDELRLLAEIGFVACGARNIRDAQAIFDNLRLLAPHRTYPYIGLAMARMAAGDPLAAVRILREEAPARDDDVLVFLALALRDANRTADSEKVLREILAREAPDAPERRLAQALLDESIGRMPRPVAFQVPSLPRARSR